jgi:hypothetical protein
MLCSIFAAVILTLRGFVVSARVEGAVRGSGKELAGEVVDWRARVVHRLCNCPGRFNGTCLVSSECTFCGEVGGLMLMARIRRLGKLKLDILLKDFAQTHPNCRGQHVGSLPFQSTREMPRNSMNWFEAKEADHAMSRSRYDERQYAVAAVLSANLMPTYQEEFGELDDR